MDSSSGDEEDFEGFVVSPEEKLSYKAWARKRRASEVFNSSDNEISGDNDDDDDDDGDEDDEDNQEDYDHDEDADESSEGEEIEEFDDPVDEMNMKESCDELSPGNTDQCPVCLMSLKQQLLGTPNNCMHVFCFECIQEWAKNATTCPVGRKPFNEILVHATKKGPILQRIPVEERQVGHDEEEEDDPTFCEVCGECNREDRMLLCDGCDNGYHMECLTPPVEFVPLEEWFCPFCSSRQETEELEDDQRMEVTRARTTRGRPRGSTLRHVSGTMRTARTVASTRGRGRTVRGRGRGRGRSSGRGGRSSSTRGRSSAKRKTKRRKNRRPGSTKKVRASSTKRRKKTSKRKTMKSTKKRRVKEEEVSPFIYEPKRRGKTVHARLLESLSVPGPSTEPSRSTSIGRMPFPSRVEPSSSFSLFGNAFALHDFDEQEQDVQGTTAKVEQATAWSSETDNPDVLGSIFQGLHTLHSSSTQMTRDGTLLATAAHTRDEGSPAMNTESKRETANNIDDKSNEKTLVEKELLKERGINSKTTNDANVSSIDNLDASKECSLEKSTDSRSKTADTALSSRSTEKTHQAHTSCMPTSPKSTFHAFRIPKRRSPLDSENESRQVLSGLGAGSTSDKNDQVSDSSISKFKIPKRTNSFGDDSSKSNFSNVMAKNSDTPSAVPRTATSSKSCEEQRVAPNFTSSNKGLRPSVCCATTSQSRSSSFDSARPVMQENLEPKNTSNLITAKKPNTSTHYSSSLSSFRANKLNSIPHSYNSTRGSANSGNVNVTRQTQKRISSCHAITTTDSASTTDVTRETKSNNVTTCHAKNFGDFPASSHFPPLTEEVSLTDKSKPVRGKEQRRSNIEILKMLHEKQRSMREQMFDDPKASSLSLQRRSSDEAHSKFLLREKLHISDESPVCSRGITLPIAVVKPSPHISNPTIASSAVIPSSLSYSSPIKSIASGIIDAHSSYSSQGLHRLHIDSRPHSGSKISKRSQSEKMAGASGDRDQQRKLGIARLQRHQQIVDEVKLALKPFFRQGKITKDDYKVIMKKSVEKIEESNSSVDRDRVGRLVKKYVHKVKGVNISILP